MEMGVGHNVFFSFSFVSTQDLWSSEGDCQLHYGSSTLTAQFGLKSTGGTRFLMENIVLLRVFTAAAVFCSLNLVIQTDPMIPWFFLDCFFIGSCEAF